MFAPLLVAGAGLGLLVSQLNNYTLSQQDRVAKGLEENAEVMTTRISGSCWPAGRQT